MIAEFSDCIEVTWYLSDDERVERLGRWSVASGGRGEERSHGMNGRGEGRGWLWTKGGGGLQIQTCKQKHKYRIKIQ